MDTQIWYSIFSTICGGVIGAFDRLGEVVVNFILFLYLERSWELTILLILFTFERYVCIPKIKTNLFNQESHETLKDTKYQIVMLMYYEILKFPKCKYTQISLFMEELEIGKLKEPKRYNTSSHNALTPS